MAPLVRPPTSPDPSLAIAPSPLNDRFPPGTVGRLMGPPLAVFRPNTTIAATVQQLRELVKGAFITYGYVTDERDRLVGVVVMRELLFADPEQPLSDVMLREPFYLRPEMRLIDAMRQVLNLHFPVYPVCDDDGRLVGLIRGQQLFEAEKVEISSQAGRMVGVEREERASTSWHRSFWLRHPWLQFNLLTAFFAAAVVGVFQTTINQMVILATFLPVITGEAGNVGAQALAVTVRAMTLGELDSSARKLPHLIKEAWLGLVNGGLTGITAGLAMYVFASMQQHTAALELAGVSFAAMTLTCAISGITGALVPLALRRVGVDPATASIIFLTTVTDTLSVALFLGFATWLLL